MTAPLDEPEREDVPIVGPAFDSRALRRTRLHGVIGGLVALAVAAVLTISVLVSPRHPWFQGFDDSTREWVVAHRALGGTRIAKFLDFVGSAAVTLPLRMVAVILLVVRRRWVQTAAFVTALAASELGIGLLKYLVGRSRPPGALVATTGSSFPSGHAVAGAVTAFGLIAAFLPRGRRRWHWITVASTLAASMAWSRVFLSAHWATDTIAGTAIGVGLALLSEALFEGGRWKAADVVLAELEEVPPLDLGGGAAERSPESVHRAGGLH